MKRITRIGTMALTLALVAGLAPRAEATDYTWKINNGMWTNAAAWDPSGGPPAAGDTGILTGLICKANANLAGGPTIEVRTNASLYCGNGGGTTFSNHTIKLNGGQWALNSGSKGIITSSDTVALESDSELRAGINGDDQQWILSGLIRDGYAGGKGRLLINTTNLFTGNLGLGFVDITGANNTYSGGTVMVGNNYGYVRVLAPGGLGQGDVQVLAGSRLNIAATNTTAAGKTITVANGGLVRLGTGGGGVAFDCRGHNFLLKEGSSLLSGLAGTVNNVVNSYDAYALEGAAQIKNDTEGTFHIYGVITNGASVGKMVVQAPRLGGYYLYLRNPGNTFSGGIDIQAAGYLSIVTNGAQGVGPITPLTATSYVLLDQTPNTDWTVTNTLAGKGTITVEAGNGANRLTCGGTVDPGVGGATVTTNTTGILTIAGAMGFAAGGQLTIDIAGTNGVAGVDFDRLKVNYALTNLNNATLYVNVATNLARNALVGQELIVLTNSTALKSTFGAVTGSGDGAGKIWTCTVVTNQPSGTVKLTQLYLRNPNAPIVNNASGVTDIEGSSASLNGTLVHTGAAPASVSVYWGTNDGGFVKSAWGNTNDFGSCTNGQALTTNVTLTPGTTYYYRYYATNTAGFDEWADLFMFATPTPPEVTTNMGPTLVEKTTATLNGILAAGGSAQVTVYWGQDTNTWANTNAFGTVYQGVGFSVNLAGLSPGTTYYYVCHAINSSGEDYSEIASFTTKPPALYTWKVNNGLWSSAVNWDPTNGPPAAGDTGILTGLTCIANANLAGGPTIEVRTNASLYCGNSASTTFSGHTIKLNGGRWALNIGGKGIIASSDTVALESDSEVRAGINGDDQQWILSGLIRDGLGGGKGKLTLNTTGLAVGNLGQGFVDIMGTNNTYSGGTVLFSDTLVNRGPVRVFAPGGLGLSNVLVSAYGYLNIGASNTTAAGRTITVENTGLVVLGIGGGGITFDCRGHNFVLKNGASLWGRLNGTPPGNRVNSYDTYALEGAARVGNAVEFEFHIYGAIADGASAGKMVVPAPAVGGRPLYLWNPGNTFSGGLDVEAAGYVSIATNNAYGAGPITLLATNSYLTLDQTPNADWTVTNTLAGKGTITVEAGANRLTCGGMVNPGMSGTNVTTNTIGILRITGKMGFAAGSSLAMGIAGTNGVAGVDYSQLSVSSGDTNLAASITNCDLSVTVAPKLMTDGMVVTNVLATGANFSSYKFRSVAWNPGWAGNVQYGNGFILLTNIRSTQGGTVLMVY